MSIDNEIDSMIMDEHQAEHNAELRRNNEIEALEKWLDENESIHGDFLVYVDDNTLSQRTRKESVCTNKTIFDGTVRMPFLNNLYYFLRGSDIIDIISNSTFTLETLDGHTFSITEG